MSIYACRRYGTAGPFEYGANFDKPDEIIRVRFLDDSDAQWQDSRHAGYERARTELLIARYYRVERQKLNGPAPHAPTKPSQRRDQMTKPTSANIPSRRGAMKIGAAAVLSASPVAAIAATAPAVDPIYVVIERHRKAWAELGRTLRASDAVLKANGWLRDAPAGTAEGRAQAASPAWTAAERAQAAAEIEVTGATVELAQTQPTTVTGIAAVLAYGEKCGSTMKNCFGPPAIRH